MKYHVIESEGKYLIVKVAEYQGKHYSLIVKEEKTLDIALKVANILNEDAVPVNSVGGGNVAGYSPLLKFKKLARRKLNKNWS